MEKGLDVEATSLMGDGRSLHIIVEERKRCVEPQPKVEVGREPVREGQGEGERVPDSERQVLVQRVVAPPAAEPDPRGQPADVAMPPPPQPTNAAPPTRQETDAPPANELLPKEPLSIVSIDPGKRSVATICRGSLLPLVLLLPLPPPPPSLAPLPSYFPSTLLSSRSHRQHHYYCSESLILSTVFTPPSFLNISLDMSKAVLDMALLVQLSRSHERTWRSAQAETLGVAAPGERNVPLGALMANANKETRKVYASLSPSIRFSNRFIVLILPGWSCGKRRGVLRDKLQICEAFLNHLAYRHRADPSKKEVMPAGTQLRSALSRLSDEKLSAVISTLEERPKTGVDDPASPHRFGQPYGLKELLGAKFDVPGALHPCSLVLLRPC